MAHPVILFDGCCELCSKSVRSIIKRDPEGRFHFASIHSKAGKALLNGCGINPGNSPSLVLVEDGVCLLKSGAVIAIASRLRGLWSGASALRFIPRPLRDHAYDLIAKNRHLLPGVRGRCSSSPPEDRTRFIG